MPSGALPTGNLPIGALPTGATGGGGSLRGRSAAAAALSMAKDAAVTMDRVFSMTNPLVFGRISAETPDEATEGRPPVFAPSLSQSGFHRCTVKKCSNRNFYTMKKRAIQRRKGSFSRRCCTNITGTASECVSDAKSGRNLRVRQPIFGQPALAFIMLSDRRDRFHMLVAVHFAQTSPVLCATDLPRAHDEFRASGCDGSAPVPTRRKGVARPPRALDSGPTRRESVKGRCRDK